jgi:competence protein ComFC
VRASDKLPKWNDGEGASKVGGPQEERLHRPYFEVLADLFYPQSCVGCTRRASDVLCRSCFGALPRIEPPVCGRCGMPTAFEVYGCDACRNTDFAFDGARAPLRYEGVGEEVVHALKYRGYARVVEKVMAPLMVALLEGERYSGVVPVPLHRARLARRGFNQAEVMARAVAARIGAPLSDKIKAVRRTRDQVELSAGERRENVAGAFEARGSLAGRILLVDDVFTTGATLSECAGVLRRAGVNEVQALTFCRTI